MAKFGRIPTDFAMQIIGFIRIRPTVKIGIFFLVGKVTILQRSIFDLDILFFLRFLVSFFSYYIYTYILKWTLVLF